LVRDVQCKGRAGGAIVINSAAGTPNNIMARTHIAKPCGRLKNWPAGISGPSGQHLVDLIRHSDDVLAVLLILAGRQQVVAVQKLVDVRNKLAETIEQVDAMMQEDNRGQ
jgi:hypothetical protein